MTRTEKILLIAAAAAVLAAPRLSRPPRSLPVPEPDRPPAEAPAGTGTALWVHVTRSVDLNSADARELDTLPGIGETLAARIVEYREAHGPFTRTEELLLIEGIREDTVRALLAGGAFPDRE